MNNFFTGCLELKYINLKYAEINASKITSPLWDDTPNDLVILSENEVWQNLFYMSEKNYINCVNNISSSNNKDKKHFQKFFIIIQNQIIYAKLVEVTISLKVGLKII